MFRNFENNLATEVGLFLKAALFLRKMKREIGGILGFLGTPELFILC